MSKHLSTSAYPFPPERMYCSPPDVCERRAIIIIGSGIALSTIRYLIERAQAALGYCPAIVIVEAGPFDLLGPVGGTGFRRWGLFKPGPEQRVGSLLPMFGLFCPRTPEEIIRLWPYDYDDLSKRFETVEADMGIQDHIPKSDGHLQSCLLDLLRKQYPQMLVQEAPIAMDRYGKRWSPLPYIPWLKTQGVQFITHFRCTRLELSKDQNRIARIYGQWLDGRTYTLTPQHVVLGVGVEAALPLLSQVYDGPFEPADHLRVDLQGFLPWDAFGDHTVDQLGIAVMSAESWSHNHIPLHLQIKLAPVRLWKRDFMPGSDSVPEASDDSDIFVQLQAVSAMHDRLSIRWERIAGKLIPVMANSMSEIDGLLHTEIVHILHDVAMKMGLVRGTYLHRPLLTNYHEYGAVRIGHGVTPNFRMRNLSNLWILPPTAFPDVEDNANPVLKSRVLAQFAMDDIVSELAGGN